MNFKDAIAAHGKWKVTLKNYLESPDGSLKPDDICKDNKCALGLWIYGESKTLCADNPDHELLRLAHARFHRATADVVRAVNQGSAKSAEQMISPESEFGRSTSDVIALLEKFDKIYIDPEAEADREPPAGIQRVAWRMEMLLKSLGRKFKRDISKRESPDYLEALSTDLKTAVTASQKATQRLLDNAGDGFISVNREGVMNPEYSKAAEDMLLQKPAGKKFASIFGTENESSIEDTVTMIFAGSLDFASMAALLPKSHFMNLQHLEFVYRPIQDENNELTDFLVIIKDVTKLKNLEKKAEKEAKTNAAIIKILSTMSDFHAVLEQVTLLEQSVSSFPEALRCLHTLKGGFGLFGLDDLMNICHEAETRLKKDSSKKVLVEAIKEIRSATDAFLDENSSILKLKSSSEKALPIHLSKINEFLRVAVHPQTPAVVQNHVDRLFQVPLSDSLSFLNRVAETTSAKLGKDVKLVWSKDILINPVGYESIFLSLSHLIRNAIDHGIEASDVRQMVGKPVGGTIQISAHLDQDFYVITVEDDGSGLDLQKIRQKAAGQGDVSKLSDSEAADLIFGAGLSTKEEVSEHSGRGVGLDAVRMEARRLGGDARVLRFSEKGTCFEVRFAKLDLARRVNRDLSLAA